MKKTIDMTEIREGLSQQFRDLPKKKTTPHIANAMCNVSGKFFTSIKLEIEAMKFAGKQFGARYLELTGASGK